MVHELGAICHQRLLALQVLLPPNTEGTGLIGHRLALFVDHDHQEVGALGQPAPALEGHERVILGGGR
ncbi:unannotated protein [freshwater metagenome]|uniref:Unannotated protein n=1 Tax=freshwater metagenome TaxID=449393 RepID=A0A6J7PMF7_9ZZZZ